MDILSLRYEEVAKRKHLAPFTCKSKASVRPPRRRLHQALFAWTSLDMQSRELMHRHGAVTIGALEKIRPDRLRVVLAAPSALELKSMRIPEFPWINLRSRLDFSSQRATR